MLTPVADWKDTKEIREEVQKQEEDESKFKKFITRVRLACGCGITDNLHGNIGFKSIRQKSLHFQSSRFRETLIEMSMLCQQNRISDFVENIGDIEILFESMSPATLQFFHNAFHKTRFTRRVENLKWPAGVALQVFGT